MVSGSTGQPNIMRVLLRAGAFLDGKDKKGNGFLDGHATKSRDMTMTSCSPSTDAGIARAS